jgi:hypothetical protein
MKLLYEDSGDDCGDPDNIKNYLREVKILHCWINSDEVDYDAEGKHNAEYLG